MSVRVAIVDGAVAAPVGGRGREPRGAGAVLVFEGLVRGIEDGRAVAALEYEVYEPMATAQLEIIGREVGEEFGLLGLEVWHSRGRVGVGECSLRVVVRSAHRRAGLEAMARYIDRLKQDVPIWKRVVWA